MSEKLKGFKFWVENTEITITRIKEPIRPMTFDVWLAEEMRKEVFKLLKGTK